MVDGSALAWKLMKRHWQLYLIILIPMVWLIIFCYVPMYGVQLAFKKFSFSKGIIDSPWIGFRYFQILFTSPSGFMIIKNTLFLSFYSLAVGFPFPIILAVALNETRSRAVKKTIQMITYAPYFISTVVLVGLMFQVLDPRLGVINRIIQLLGFQPINFMGSASAFPSVYVWSGIWQGMGYAAVIYLAALSSVSPELQEAARIDGCTRFQRVMNVDIPGIFPTIITLLVLNFGYIMSVGFEKVYLMQNAMNQSTSEIISTYVYKVGLVNADFGFSTAIGLFNSVVNVVLLLTVNKIAQKSTGAGLW
jgi:putative aldouronate transport system permease protein